MNNFLCGFMNVMGVALFLAYVLTSLAGHGESWLIVAAILSFSQSVIFAQLGGRS